MAKSNDKHAETTNATVTVAVLIAGVSVIIGIVAAKNMISSINFNARVLTAKTKAKKQLDANLAAIPQLLDNYNALGDRKQLINDALPIEPDFPQIVSLMERLSVTSGVKMKSIDPTGTASATTVVGAPGGEAPVPVPFSIAVDTNYGNLLQLLKNIELSARPIKVTTISVGGTPNAMSVSLELSSFYQPPADLTDKTETIQ